MPNPPLAAPLAGLPHTPALVPEDDPGSVRRSEITSLLDHGLRLTAADGLVVVFTAELKPAAVRVAAAARRAGAAVRLAASARWDTPLLGQRVRAALRELGRSGPVPGARSEAAPGPGSGSGPVAARHMVLFLGGVPLDHAALDLAPQVVGVQLPAGTTESGALLPGWEDPDRYAARLRALVALTASSPRIQAATGDGAMLLLGRDPGVPPRIDPDQPVPGELRLLPSAVVETRVAEADGVFVADGTLQVNRSVRLGGTLASRPVRLELTEGRVTRLSCPDPHTEGFLLRAVTTHGVDRLRSVRCRPAEGGTGVALCLTAESAEPHLRVHPRVHPDPSADLRIVLGAAQAHWLPRPERT